jgi:hypothetical protein
MRKVLILIATLATLGASIVAPQSAQARDGGAIVGGVLGGLAVGTMLGAAVAQPRYYGPPPAYAEPVYVAPPPPRCFWTRGEPEWDGYRGVWVRPRVRVCD